jgi:hypothetical protein
MLELLIPKAGAESHWRVGGGGEWAEGQGKIGAWHTAAPVTGSPFCMISLKHLELPPGVEKERQKFCSYQPTWSKDHPHGPQHF